MRFSVRLGAFKVDWEAEMVKLDEAEKESFGYNCTPLELEYKKLLFVNRHAIELVGVILAYGLHLFWGGELDAFQKKTRPATMLGDSPTIFLEFRDMVDVKNFLKEYSFTLASFSISFQAVVLDCCKSVFVSSGGYGFNEEFCFELNKIEDK